MKNFSSKIKGFATTILVIGCIVGGIYLASSIYLYINNSDYIRYVNEYDYPTLMEAGQKALTGLRGIYISIPLIIICIVAFFPLYGIGELVEINNKNNKILFDTKLLLEKLLKNNEN
jgi:hypothetical protein